MEYLIQKHEKRGDKVLVFCDCIPLLEYCARLLNKVMIHGSTNNVERGICLNGFNQAKGGCCLFISSVGDTSIDLPNVNVVIQISSHYGSRRQEAQRLGRILRPKPKDKMYDYNAFFYTLISKDTKDMIHSAKRQSFLVDQGYSFHVITNLIHENTPNLKCLTRKVKNELLMEAKKIKTKQDGLKMFVNGDDMNDKLRVNTQRTSQSSSAIGFLSCSAKKGKQKRGNKRKANTTFFQRAYK